jgi:hypothetical protein
MGEMIYIVIYRGKSQNKWHGESNGVFEGPDAERLAHNYVECMNRQSESLTYAVVRGPIVNPVDMAAAEAALGAF